MNKRINNYLIGFLIGALGGLIGLGLESLTEKLLENTRFSSAPNKIELIPDLNQDGIDDAILLRINGYKTPFYGTRTNGVYLTNSQTEKINPTDIIDYKKIEQQINK
jgi:hypothetical protein